MKDYELHCVLLPHLGPKKLSLGPVSFALQTRGRPDFGKLLPHPQRGGYIMMPYGKYLEQKIKMRV